MIDACLHRHRHPLGQLRRELADLRRGRPLPAAERARQADHDLQDRGLLLQLRDDPPQPGQVALVVHVANSDHNPENKASFPYLPVGELVVARAATLAKVKAALVPILPADLAAALPSTGQLAVAPRLRLRELLGEKVAHILSQPDASLADNLPERYAKTDAVDVVVNVLDADEALLPGQILLDTYVHVLGDAPEDDTLDGPFELAIAATATKDDLAAALASAHGLPAVAVAKLYYRTQLDEVGAEALAWDVDGAAVLNATPWYLRDGDLVVARDLARAEARAAAAAAAAATEHAAASKANTEVALAIHVQTAEERAAYAELLSSDSNADAPSSSQ